ncbi:MalY/PatB family protein [Paenibacillus protaetiae]|uniref:cysteine-S-conjugate beta-lyase n=1 Tax=Paenibacillus protaetiae TaxID=2509456 RepID=A0A4P6F3V5_9BACL|nr:MalY/PatB family protein [Paenibacillus protaetiae]QAY65068.1 pyridoxal phosphate-dependent aminotransferase [Paenibacillus protaetiae]
MKYDFDRIIDRTGTRAVKWDSQFLDKVMDAKDALPLWVADTDFPAPEVVVEALRSRVEHRIFGYPYADDAYYDSVIYWMDKRHGWPVRKEWISIMPGIVPALSFIVRAFTEPGEGVIIQEPVYAPFRQTIEGHGRQLLNNKLVETDSGYCIDYEDLESKAAMPAAKLLILCNPHNPVGRVWSEEELRKVGDICLKHGVLVVSDEIHHDLILFGNKHTCYAKLGEQYAAQSIVCTAPSKTFNIAGLSTSNIITPNPALKKRLDKEMNLFHVGGANLLGLTAAAAAYSPEGEEWLEQLLAYLEGNAVFVKNFLAEKLPKVRYRLPEGTYLAWLDFRGIMGSSKQLERTIKKEAKVLLNPGFGFGEGGDGFMRLNFGCPRAVLEEALERISRPFQV